jgi:hypothetical protein
MQDGGFVKVFCFSFGRGSEKGQHGSSFEKCHLLIFCVLNGVKMLKNAGKPPVIYNLGAIRQLTGGLKNSPTNEFYI